MAKVGVGVSWLVMVCTVVELGCQRIICIAYCKLGL